MELGRGLSLSATHAQRTDARTDARTGLSPDRTSRSRRTPPTMHSYQQQPGTSHAPACPTLSTSAAAPLRLLSLRTLLRPAGRSGVRPAGRKGGSHEAVEVVVVVVAQHPPCTQEGGKLALRRCPAGR